MKRKRMPAVFLGHGTPLNFLRVNVWTETWRRVGLEIGRPEAILVVSGHWCTRGTAVTATEMPRTIHDFGGFPKPLHDFQYRAPGDRALAKRVSNLLGPMPVKLDETWGFDHGTWVVLSKAYPAADVPVVVLSIDISQPPQFHFDIGSRLAPLRDEGILILGSGNVVHNLALFERDAEFAYDWADRFNSFVRESLLERAYENLIDFESCGRDAVLSVPTPDHYYPLLYAAGAARDDAVTIEIDGVCAGAMSMLCAVFGGKPGAMARP